MSAKTLRGPVTLLGMLTALIYALAEAPRKLMTRRRGAAHIVIILLVIIVVLLVLIFLTI
ncbi:MAG: hypothetical protein ACLQEQ_02435 [Nitrososphaerales archaeon]